MAGCTGALGDLVGTNGASENEDDRIIWYQNMHGIWKKAEVNDQIIKIPATAFQVEYEQQWLGEIHFNL